MIDPAPNPFLNACGLADPLVLGILDPGAAGTEWRAFDQPFVLVGRDPHSDLCLGDPLISRRHAYFQVVAGRLFCVDLHSRTGTHWSDEPGLWGWVSPNAAVRLGAYHVRPRNVAFGATPVGPRNDAPLPVSRSFVEPKLPDLELEIVGRGGDAATWQASRSLILVGKSNACKVRLPGEGIANIHASLVRTAAGLFVVDLRGPQGVRLNGQPVRWAPLEDGDELRMGGYRIRIRGGSASTVAGQPGPPPTAHAARSMLGGLGLAAPAAADPVQAGILDVLQSIVSLQQDQMAVLREELAEIRRLAAEQHALQVAVERHARAAQAPARVLKVVAGEPRSLSARTLPAPPSAPRADLAGRPLAIKDDSPRLAIGQDRPTPPGAEAPEDPAFDARIFDQLAQIQGERLTRWQRLKDTVLGKE